MTIAPFKYAALALPLSLLCACGGGGGGTTGSATGSSVSTPSVSAVTPVQGFAASDKIFAVGDVHALVIKAASVASSAASAATTTSTVAATPGGSLYSWGSNLSGQLGTGNLTASSTPQLLASSPAWNLVSAGALFSLGLRSDGSLWTWGSNQDYQLGQSLLSNTIKSTPTKITITPSPKDISAGTAHAAVVLTNGTLWSWGLNDHGQLGINTTSDATKPTQVGVATNWESVSAGGAHTLAKQQVTNYLYAWGANANGQLGQGSTTDIGVPTQVNLFNSPAGTVAVFSAGGAHSMAIGTDGTLWVWGANGSGQVGDSSTLTDYPFPYQVGTNTNWARVAAGGLHSLALTTDGRLFSWGSNQYGQLGNGTTTDSNVPTQVGTASNWVAIAAGTSASMGVQSDGSLWVWGRNDSGQLGLGNTTSPVSTPTQHP